MRLLSSFAALVLLVLALPATTMAQAPSSSEASSDIITFDEAVRIALQQSIAIRRAGNTVAVQQNTVLQQRYSLFPSLSVSVTGNQSFGQAWDETAGELTYEGRSAASGGLSANMTLFDGFRSWAELSRARHQVEAGEVTLQQQRQDIIFNVMTHYLNLINARENVHIQEENLRAAERQLEEVEDHVRTGARRATDLHEQRSQVAAARLALLQARRGAQEHEGQLIQLLQLDPFGEYEFEIPTLEDELVPEQYQAAALVEEAFSRRHDLRAQQASIAAAEQGVRAARGGWFPTLSLNASTGSSYSSLGRGNFSDQFFELNRSERISVSLSFPLFDRFQTRTQVRQASIEYENARLDLEERRQEVAVQVRQAYLDYEAMIEELEVATLRAELAERSLEAAEDAYRVGQGTLTEVTQARNSYVQAQSDLVQAQYELIFQQRTIDYYIGALDPEQPLFE